MKLLFSYNANEIPKENGALLAEVGDYGVSFLWYKPNPFTLSGVSSYSFTKGKSSEDIAAQLKALCSAESFQQLKTTICTNSSDTLIIPDQFYNPQINEQLLNLLYGLNNREVRIDDLKEQEILGNTSAKNLYRISSETSEIIKTIFPTANILHSTSVQILNEKSADVIRVIFYQQYFKVLVFSGGRFKFSKLFFYKTPLDVAYNLLNTSEQLGLSATHSDLLISGIIEKESGLYRELSKYFQHIHFEMTESIITTTNRSPEIAPHYYSYLIQLAQCVL